MRKQNLMLFPPEIASEFVAEQVIFDELKHGIWANEKAIQTNTEMINELYQKYKEEHK